METTTPSSCKLFPSTRIQFNCTYPDYVKRHGRPVEFDVSCQHHNNCGYDTRYFFQTYPWPSSTMESITIHVLLCILLLFMPLTQRIYQELEAVQRFDDQKQLICRINGVSLVVVPYWWDKTLSSVAVTIHRARPDILFPSSVLQGQPIPQSPNPLPRQPPDLGVNYCAMSATAFAVQL